jgi:hypothetical protein
MTNIIYPVETYVKHLSQYLQGDLGCFHRLCHEAEAKDGAPGISGAATYDTSSLQPPAATNSSSTTAQTTIPSAGQTPVNFRSTIPHTLALFSTMDVLGFLFGTHASPTKTFKNLSNFLTRTSLSSLEKDALREIYRNGMVHGYFPKEGLGIAYHTSNPQGNLFFKRTGIVILNVNELESIVLAQIGQISPSDIPSMDLQYQKLLQEYTKKCAPIIGQLMSLL